MSKPLIQKLNAVDGKLEWEFEEDEELKNEIARSTYAGMLHDTERNQKYFNSLIQSVDQLVKSNKSTITLDIGTGTGLLAMMAAKAGAASVTACEIFKPMSHKARKVIQDNNLQDKITVINKCSSSMLIPGDMPVKADILVTEIFDTELIGEGVLPTLRDAHHRLLKKNCVVIPSSANVKIQLVSSKKLAKMNKLNETNFENVNFPVNLTDCPGLATPYEIQINQLYPNDLRLLTEVCNVKCFNFTAPYYHDSVTKDGLKYSRNEVYVEIIEDGVVDAVLMWWDLVLNEHSQITLSLEPIWMRKESYQWRDHWMQAVYYLKKALRVSKGDWLYVTMFHDDYSVWYNVSSLSVDYIDRPLCTCGLHTSWSRQRFAMINSDEYHSYCHKLVRSITSLDLNKKLLIIGDTSLLPLHFNNKRQISYIEYSLLSTKIISTILKQNKFNVDVIQKSDYVIDTDTCFDLLVEPYFSCSMLPWHHLIVWHFLSKCIEESKKFFTIYPNKAQLKVCMVTLKDLWKVRAPVNHVCSFDLSSFDSFINEALAPEKVDQYGDFYFVEPFSMWEFENIIISDTVVIHEFELTDKIPNDILNFKKDIKIKEEGICHAAVIWVDIFQNEELMWTMGLSECKEWVSYVKQGVFFMSSPTLVKKNDTIRCNSVFLPQDCEVLFNFC